jgi:hypothetical protein
VWVFTRSGSTWTQQGGKLTAKSPEEIGEGAFGNSVALSSDGSTTLIGGFFDNNGVGAAWAFLNPPPTPTASVSLASTTIKVDRRGEAAIMLTCTGSAPACGGTLTLSVQFTIGKGKKKHSFTVPIGAVSGSIPSGKTTTVELQLDIIGRVLLAEEHGQLSASLTILKTSPAPSEEQSDTVYLVQRKADRW